MLKSSYLAWIKGKYNCYGRTSWCYIHILLGIREKFKGRKKWINESKDRVDFYVGYNLFMDKERT